MVKKATIDFIDEGNISAKKIAPLILMPFVENGFKHGISNASAANIVIKLTASDNDEPLALKLIKNYALKLPNYIYSNHLMMPFQEENS